MSDIEKQIEQWQIELAGSELLGHSDVKELESHLREEMERLRASGLSDEEAFFVGRHRLGDTAALADEFAKVNPPRRSPNHLWWILAGVLVYLIAVQFSHTASQISLAIMRSTGLSHEALGLIGDTVRVLPFSYFGTLALWFTFGYARRRSCSCLRVSRRIQTVLLLGLLIELLAINTIRMVGTPQAAFRMAPQTVVTFEPLGLAAWIIWPVLLVALVVVLHLAQRQKTELQ